MSRYVVTEIEGFLTHDGNGRVKASHPEGLSCHVIDAPWNRRLVASYRTEYASYGRTTEEKREAVRREAREHAERLNAAHVREAVSPHSERTA